MRSVTDRVKLDFIRKNKHEATERVSSNPSESRPDLSRRSASNTEPGDNKKSMDAESPSKRGRSRSRTFTFSKGDSPKKQKAGGANTGRPDKPVNLPKSPSSTSVASIRSSSSSKSAKVYVPEEFVTYLQKTPKPQDVEVGKIHKLRLLLRNETVSWVDKFLSLGGMNEVVGLITRTLEIEWREEHEDALLHETLLCLKGLCTADLSLRKLCDFEQTLFPILLKMLFDEERKGPSEFVTREIVIKILCK